MNVKEGTLVRLNTAGYSDYDGNLGIIVKIMDGCFDFDELFKIFFFDTNEIRWYTRKNFQVLA